MSQFSQATVYVRSSAGALKPPTCLSSIDPEACVIMDGKVYLYRSPTARERFKAATEENFSKASANERSYSLSSDYGGQTANAGRARLCEVAISGDC